MNEMLIECIHQSVCLLRTQDLEKLGLQLADPGTNLLNKITQAINSLHSNRKATPHGVWTNMINHKQHDKT